MRIVAPESGSAARCAAKSSDVAKKRRVGAAAGAEAGIEEAGGKAVAEAAANSLPTKQTMAKPPAEAASMTALCSAKESAPNSSISPSNATL